MAQIKFWNIKNLLDKKIKTKNLTKYNFDKKQNFEITNILEKKCLIK